jgi:aerobic-type carbon monoxide dehydrogenase small subunit (CoxS/CutS family)
MALCGTRTVHINGQPTRSCVLPRLRRWLCKNVTTIEGLTSDNSHPGQKAWIEADAPKVVRLPFPVGPDRLIAAELSC